jgi:DNA-binding HxlR family transcriptional regulator
MRQRHRKSECPVHYALETFGDAWTLLIIRDLFLGRRTYSELLAAPEGIATNVLADRLVRLEEDGIVTKEELPGRGTPTLYQLTEKGLDLLPIMLEMIKWSVKHDSRSKVTREEMRRRTDAMVKAAAKIRAQLRREKRKGAAP